MQYKVLEPGIEVSGQSLGAILDGFKQYPSIAMKYLVKHGVLKKSAAGAPEIDRSGWYPLENWLAAYEGIANEVGVNSLYSVGKGIPKNVEFPPHIQDIIALLTAVDVVYHLNHRKNGAVMFNPETGQMLDGVGHYAAKADPEQKRVVTVCDNPYPCDFDRGLLTAMANRFQEDAKTIHDNNAPCRKKGGESCTYVTWW